MYLVPKPIRSGQHCYRDGEEKREAKGREIEQYFKISKGLSKRKDSTYTFIYLNTVKFISDIPK